MKSHLITAVVAAATSLGVVQVLPTRVAELEVDRLIVRGELIVSDTGQPWEQGFKALKSTWWRAASTREEVVRADQVSGSAVD
jgi:hypothetical protein